MSDDCPAGPRRGIWDSKRFPSDNGVAAIQNNEGKSCDAVVKLLERRTGKERADISQPEKDGIGPPVDLRLFLGTQSYALEHTQIEAFAGQIHMEAEFGQFINPITNELSGTLPGPGVYHLYFPIKANLGVKDCLKIGPISRMRFIWWKLP